MSIKSLLWLGLALVSQASTTIPHARGNDSFPYQLLEKSCINQDCSATRITISNPPINLWNAQLIQQFNSYLLSVNDTSATTPKVVVISSDVPDFYIAHLDLHLLSATHPPPPQVNVTDTLNKYYENLNLLLSIPVIFVAEITGRAWGSGDEHLMHMDMRFAGPDAVFSAPETALGVIHVGGLQWLVESIGPSRTMEYMLSSAQVNATQAASIGWVNSAYTSAEALRNHVDTLVTRIAKFEVDALRATKKSVAQQKPTQEMFAKDQATFAALASEPSVQAVADKILNLSGDQGKAWELNISDNIVRDIY
ncbi:putative mitochondrial enoyl-CoA hydratase 2 [Lachnellula arida]|uniref:Putative mitochondrial enoyl-CoA hydratase 2 n=1 Tax=Lachnellula arida TaxID=1316785 RepID=A0A8T9B078_9HELO|nr:putative mitochondrial enoyl-CoA hydratase 2 [Lachnellula arida]